MRTLVNDEIKIYWLLDEAFYSVKYQIIIFSPKIITSRIMTEIKKIRTNANTLCV